MNHTTPNPFDFKAILLLTDINWSASTDRNENSVYIGLASGEELRYEFPNPKSAEEYSEKLTHVLRAFYDAINWHPIRDKLKALVAKNPEITSDGMMGLITIPVGLSEIVKALPDYYQPKKISMLRRLNPDISGIIFGCVVCFKDVKDISIEIVPTVPIAII